MYKDPPTNNSVHIAATDLLETPISKTPYYA